MPYLKIESVLFALFAYSDNYHLFCDVKRTHRASYSVTGQADGLRPFLFFISVTMTSARMITTFEDKTVIGRKEHRCDLCGCRIEKGERHRMQRNLFDGAFYVWREHLVCHSVANQLKMYEQCDDGLTESIFQELLIDKAVELDVEYNNRPYKEVAEDILRLLSDPTNP